MKFESFKSPGSVSFYRASRLCHCEPPDIYHVLDDLETYPETGFKPWHIVKIRASDAHLFLESMAMNPDARYMTAKDTRLKWPYSFQ